MRAGESLCNLEEFVRHLQRQPGQRLELTEGDHARVAPRGTNNLEAWLLRVEAYVVHIKFKREENFRSRELYEAASEADQNWGRPLAGIAMTHWLDARKGWSVSREESIRLGMEIAERAIAIDPNEPLGYMALGNLNILIGNQTRGIKWVILSRIPSETIGTKTCSCAPVYRSDLG